MVEAGLLNKSWEYGCGDGGWNGKLRIGLGRWRDGSNGGSNCLKGAHRMYTLKARVNNANVHLWNHWWNTKGQRDQIPHRRNNLGRVGPTRFYCKDVMCGNDMQVCSSAVAGIRWATPSTHRHWGENRNREREGEERERERQCKTQEGRGLNPDIEQIYNSKKLSW